MAVALGKNQNCCISPENCGVASLATEALLFPPEDKTEIIP